MNGMPAIALTGADTRRPPFSIHSAHSVILSKVPSPKVLCQKTGGDREAAKGNNLEPTRTLVKGRKSEFRQKFSSAECTRSFAGCRMLLAALTRL